MAPLLSRLPRPVWLSVYDGANIGADLLAERLDLWLHAYVGIFQDAWAAFRVRNAGVAREYADVLIRHFGRARVQMIAKAFRSRMGGGLRPATAGELKEQLDLYDGFSVYLFEGHIAYRMQSLMSWRSILGCLMTAGQNVRINFVTYLAQGSGFLFCAHVPCDLFLRKSHGNTVLWQARQ